MNIVSTQILPFPSLKIPLLSSTPRFMVGLFLNYYCCMYIYIYIHTYYIHLLYLYTCVHIAHWVHLVLLLCTCIHGWSLEIGQPMWELVPGEDALSIIYLSAVIDTCDSPARSGTMWHSPVHIAMPAGVLIIPALFRQPHWWDSICAFSCHALGTLSGSRRLGF